MPQPGLAVPPCRRGAPQVGQAVDVDHIGLPGGQEAPEPPHLELWPGVSQPLGHRDRPGARLPVGQPAGAAGHGLDLDAGLPQLVRQHPGPGRHHGHPVAAPGEALRQHRQAALGAGGCTPGGEVGEQGDAQGAGSRRSSGMTVEGRPHPPLQCEQAPELLAVVAGCRRGAPARAWPTASGRHSPRRRTLAVAQQVAQRLAQRAPQPRRHRHVEPLLAAAGNRGRQDLPGDAAQEQLAFPEPDLARAGERPAPGRSRSWSR